ncbi:MAG: aspartyl protease family protein [Pseudomonadales bacterium]|nr:aspartyl protease family protein [Pseudomonadales bacterium]
MWNYFNAIILGSAFSVLSLPAAAEIYQYTNEQGRKIYVDRLSQVPARYRKQLKIRKVVELNNSQQQQREYDLQNSNFAKSITTRNKIAELSELKTRLKTQVGIYANQVIVPVLVKYKGKTQSLNLLLDTGASLTVFHLGSIANFDQKQAPVSYAQVAGGGLIKTWQLSLQQITYGPYHSKAKPVMIIEHKGNANYDGLLGMDLLAATEYKIDFQEKYIIWNQDAYLQVEQQINSLNLLLQ